MLLRHLLEGNNMVRWVSSSSSSSSSSQPSSPSLCSLWPSVTIFFSGCSPFRIFVYLFLVLSYITSLDGEKILGEENDEFDFDGLPGAQHEFKVDIPGSTEDCFFQPVAKGAKFHVNFEVLKGGDKHVDFYIRDQQWRVVQAQSYKTNGHASVDATERGVYAVCIDNVFSRFGSKLVYIHLVTFIMEEWVQFQRELGELHILADNFTTSLSSVQQSIAAVKEFQTNSRFNVIKDWYLVTGNNHYVMVWSCAQCVLIVAAAMLQVFSVRRLFRGTNVTPTTAKPRA